MTSEKPETIGDLYDRIPPTGEWVHLPEYGVRVARFEDPETVRTIREPAADHHARLAPGETQ